MDGKHKKQVSFTLVLVSREYHFNDFHLIKIINKREHQGHQQLLNKSYCFVMKLNPNCNSNRLNLNYIINIQSQFKPVQNEEFGDCKEMQGLKSF